jgi:hypothetical protein
VSQSVGQSLSQSVSREGRTEDNPMQMKRRGIKRVKHTEPLAERRNLYSL